MIARWEKGRAEIDRLLAEQRLERVSPNRDLAEQLIAQAEVHLITARAALELGDAPGAFQLVYDAARKALTAVLANQGLRARGTGAHATVYDAVRAQLHPPLGPILAPFDWMRRLRNTTEYPEADKPIATGQDVGEAIPATTRIIETAGTVLDRMPVY